MTPLLSPVTQAPLQVEGSGLLRDLDGRLWPVIDGIPYLRIGRDALVEEAADRQLAGDREGALLVLLGDQDDWWTGAEPDGDALRRLIRNRDQLALREAMACLAFDRVGDYFAHRWSDPTFLAGLSLLEAHWQPTRTAFELACGIGHYGRELARRGVEFTGGDVVFAKLWLARHWVLPAEARLICFDAAAPWPIADQHHDLAFCHDAFYFLEPKAEILSRLKALAQPAGRIAVSHIHNSGADNLSSGHAVSAEEMARLFPHAAIYDDAELTRALIETRVPQVASLEALAHVEAFSVEIDGQRPRKVVNGLSVPPIGAALRLNPLYVPNGGGWAVEWPTSRYRSEYEARSTFPVTLDRRDGAALVETADECPSAMMSLTRDEAIRRRVLVDLPERW